MATPAARRPPFTLSQSRIVGGGHADEAAVALLAESGLIPVKSMWSVIAITDRGGRSARRLPAALVQQQSLAAEFRSMRGMALFHFVGAATFVIVGAALQHGDRRRSDMTQHQPTGMAGDAGLGKIRLGRS